MYTCNLPLKFQGKWIHMRKVMSNFLFLSFFQKSHSFWQASLPIQNHPKLPITEKRRNSTKYLTWNSRGPKFVKKTSMPISVEGLEDLQLLEKTWNHPGNKKRPHFSWWSTILLFACFSKTLLTTERRLTEWYFLEVDLSPIFLNTGPTDETFQQRGKQGSLWHILKSLWKFRLTVL